MFGGELAVDTFREFGDPTARGADRVMHSVLETSAGFTLMAGDAPEGTEFAPVGISISLSGNDADALRGYWKQLSDGSAMTMPLAQQVWGDEFSMATTGSVCLGW